MKLSTRVSTFFLTALAIILIGNSLALYGVARTYLYRRFDEQLRSSLNTLTAAIEVEDDDVKWEPTDHSVTLGAESGVEDVRWLVCDELDAVVDMSPNLASSEDVDPILQGWRNQDDDQSADAGWRFLSRSLAAPDPKPGIERTPLEHAKLTVIVARNVAELSATLNWWAAMLVVLPGVCWLASAFAGQWYCQKAIAPVRQMAINARGIQADDTHARLPVPQSRDELQELGRAFNELLDELFTGYERQRRFATDAAHQLRTPLTVMQGHVELARRKRRSTEEYEETLAVVNQEIGSLTQTIEALLFLARPDDERRQPDAKPIEFSVWCQEYLQHWDPHPRRNELSATVAPGLFCTVPPALLNELLDILISNAFKYSPDGTPVELQIEAMPNAVRISVFDRGIGISAEDASEIFEPFFRARRARQTGAAGTGLGLAIARRIVAALRGSLTCSPRPEGGSQFVATLPRSTFASPPAQKPTAIGSLPAGK